MDRIHNNIRIILYAFYQTCSKKSINIFPFHIFYGYRLIFRAAVNRSYKRFFVTAITRFNPHERDRMSSAIQGTGKVFKRCPLFKLIGIKDNISHQNSTSHRIFFYTFSPVHNGGKAKHFVNRIYFIAITIALRQRPPPCVISQLITHILHINCITNGFRTI